MSDEKKVWKAQVEVGFENLGRSISRRPWLWLIGCLVIIGLLVSQLIHVRTDSSIEGFLEEGDIQIVKYNHFKDTFGRDQTFIIDLEVKDVFDPEFIKYLRALHKQLEEGVPYVNTVDSLVNARHTYGEDDTLYIEELLPEELPEDPADLEALKSYTYNSTTYRGFLFSEDRQLTTIVVKLDAYLYKKDADGKIIETNLEDKELREALEAIEGIIEQHKGIVSDEITMAGTLPISILIGKIVKRDFTVFSALSILLVAVLLFGIFRRASGVTMPLVITVLGIIATISVMAAAGRPITMSTSILPSFLLAVCVGDSIHLLAIFYRRFDQGEEKVDSLCYALGHTGLAIFFTSITTAAGLASFSTSSLAHIAALGTFGAAGSIIAFLLTVLILPCLIAIFPLKRKPEHEHKTNLLEKILHFCVNASTTYPKPIAAIGILIFILAGYFTSQLTFSHHPLDWLPSDDPAIKAVMKHEERMGGNTVIEVMIDTGKDRGIVDAEFLQELDKAMQEIKTWKTDAYSVSKVISVTDVIKESNRALHDNDEAHYVIPDNSNLISQELFLVELDEPDDLFNLIDRNYQTLRLTIITPWVDAIYYTPRLEKLNAFLEERVGQYSSEITITGISAVLGSTFAAMLYSTAESYMIAGILITIMMILLVGDLKLGLLSMIPSVLPILMVMALLRVIGMPLDLFTMIIGSIAIGLTVDDNVHFMHGFKREYLKTGDPAKAIELTMLSTGRAMLVTTIVLSLGFLVYTQSMLNNLIGFGIMTALCLSLALLATFLVTPSLMMLVNHSSKALEDMEGTQVAN